jgi:uncharacterized membrane protein YqgA involved in biofilm formation
MGTLINVAAILIGSALGMVFNTKLPEKALATVMQGVGLFVVFIGLQMTLSADFSSVSGYFLADGVLVILVCVLVGGIVGSLLGIEKRLDALGQAIERRYAKSTGSGQIAQGFVVASLLFCVGPMAIVGSINDALLGDIRTLATKAVLDGTASIAFASTLGVGVAFSAVAVLVYQGTITLLASLAQSVLSAPVVHVMQGVGGLLVLGIGINLLGMAKIKVGDLLPALLSVSLLVAVRSAAALLHLI